MRDAIVDHVFICPANFDESYKFYTTTMGLEPKSSWGGDGEPRGALLSSGRFVVVLAEPHPEDKDQSWAAGYKENRPTIHLAVKNLDKAFSEMKTKDRVRIAPEQTHWGTKWFVLEDPDGNMIAINEQSD
ncbi:MAG TPA: VOC family protein [Xanthobacteraceae bacterium]|jgi:uncharacterized glyoxalase superfamily protein PhnB